MTMKVRILYTDPETGTENEENIRYTDEVGEDEGYTETQITEMENELRKVGRYHLSATRCCWKM